MRTLAAKYRFCSLVLLAVLSFAASNVAAIPIAEYHADLERAIVEIESLLTRDENESDDDYEARFNETISLVRDALPVTQQVEWEKATWSTDNTWLHKTLQELQQGPLEERQMKLERLAEWLRAVDQRVTDFTNAQTVDADKAAEKQKLESILARPEYEFGPGGQSALSRLLLDFIRWLQKWLPELPQVSPGRANVTSFILQVIVVAAALLLILYIGRLLFIRFRRPRKAKVRKKREARIVLGERLQPDATATDLLAEAETLARNGDLRAAIRKGYIALLVELGDRNVISLAQYKTNRDYLRAVSNRPQLHSPLKRLTESFERHWYGFVQVTPNDWQDFRAGYREALQTGN